MPNLRIVSPGDIYGGFSVIMKEEHLFSSIARENSVIMSFSEEVLSQMKAENFELWAKLHRMLCLQVVAFLFNVDRHQLRFEALCKDF